MNNVWIHPLAALHEALGWQSPPWHRTLCRIFCWPVRESHIDDNRPYPVLPAVVSTQIIAFEKLLIRGFSAPYGTDRSERCREQCIKIMPLRGILSLAGCFNVWNRLPHPSLVASATTESSVTDVTPKAAQSLSAH